MRGARQAATVATGFVPGVAPPVPSDYYRTDPDSTRGNDIASQAYRTALANYRRWQDAHSAAQVEVVAWLASSGVLGPEARAAHVAYVGQVNIVKTAEDAVRAAQAREDEAKEKLAEGVRAARLDPKGRLPLGGTAVTAGLEVTAAQLVLAEVYRSAPAVNQAWGQTVTRADWRAVLAAVERMHGDGGRQGSRVDTGEGSSAARRQRRPPRLALSRRPL